MSGSVSKMIKPVLVRQWSIPEPCIFCKKQTQSLSLYSFVGSCDLVCHACFTKFKEKYDDRDCGKDTKEQRVNFLKEYKLHNT